MYLVGVKIAVASVFWSLKDPGHDPGVAFFLPLGTVWGCCCGAGCGAGGDPGFTSFSLCKS